MKNMTPKNIEKAALLIVANWCKRAETTMFEDIPISENTKNKICSAINALGKGTPFLSTTKEIIDYVNTNRNTAI